MTESEYIKQRNQKRISQHKCVSCNADLGEDTRRLCPKCRSKYNAHQKEMRLKRYESGLCVKCGAPLKSNKFKNCFECRVKESERCKAYYHRKKAAKDV